MYRINEEKVFADSVDGQLVVLMTETGTYYTFNEAATAIVRDLTAGHDGEAAAKAVEKASGGTVSAADAAGAIRAFVAELLEKGILEECADGAEEPFAAAEGSAMALLDPAVCAGGFAPEMTGYDDVASYFMVDPIHEADPDLGWPHAKPEE